MNSFCKALLRIPTFPPSKIGKTIASLRRSVNGMFKSYADLVCIVSIEFVATWDVLNSHSYEIDGINGRFHCCI